jgi:hypothetical protein
MSIQKHEDEELLRPVLQKLLLTLLQLNSCLPQMLRAQSDRVQKAAEQSRTAAAERQTVVVLF